MILKNSITYQNIFKNFGQKIFLLVTVFFMATISAFGVSAQSEINTKVWDESNSELNITSPISTIEVDQSFYLRFTQNIGSFEKTSNISWSVDKTNGQIVYTRSVDSNKDNNEVVKITEPGNYIIKLNLNVESSKISTSKKLKVLPKNSDYFKGLIINEIDFNNSKIEIYNDSNHDLDTSNLSLLYNIDSKFNLSNIETIPAQSYAVYDISPKLNSFNDIKLVYIKNNPAKDVFSIDHLKADEGIQYASSQTLQFDQSRNIWEKSNSTFGQKNVFNLVMSAQNAIKANAENEINVDTKFNRTQIIRTGGQDNNFTALIPFLIISIIYLVNLAFENLNLKNSISKLEFLIQIFKIDLNFIYLKLIELSFFIDFKNNFIRKNLDLIYTNTIMSLLILNQILV